jgi:hypothetical protein
MLHRIDPKAAALLLWARRYAVRGAAACSPGACARASGPRLAADLGGVRPASHDPAVGEARRGAGGWA